MGEENRLLHSAFSLEQRQWLLTIYAQDDAKQKEEAAAIQDVQSYMQSKQQAGKTIKMKFTWYCFHR